MTSKQALHHAINYIEFLVTDMEKAKKFFSSAFGWQFNEYGPEYAGIKQFDGEGECGGLCLADKVVPGGPLVILFSNNLEQSYESVKLAGGTITTETFSFPGGRRFHFADPSGNILAVWSDTIPS